MDEPMKTARDGIAIVGEIIKAAGDNPQVKEAGVNLGQTALTITKTINNALLPLAAINFAFDKARVYFAEKFQSDLSAKAATIPVECLVEPKASIAGPALQGLAFTHEEPNLKDMYLSLLATAMDGRHAHDAHPAFIEIIKQLNSEKARLLREILDSPGATPIVEIRRNNVGRSGWTVLQPHVLNLRESSDGEPVENNTQLAAMVDNWVRLGLADVDYTVHITDQNAYGWVEGRPEYQRFREQIKGDDAKITFAKGRLVRTSLGLQFARAAGLL